MSKTTRVLFAAVACAFVVTQATAQDAAAPSVSLGGGLRAGASWGDPDDAYGLNNVRLYANASAYGWLGVEVNTETDTLDHVRILDAVAKISLSDQANVWVGRFLAPSDRANLSGPYYGNVGNDHARGSRYYWGGNNVAGRDDGLAISGRLTGSGADGEMNLKYAVGIFDGAADADGNQMFAGRLTMNLWDNEAGYYNASTHYGEKEVLAIGLSYQTESADGAGLAGAGGGAAGSASGNGFEDALSVDVLLEKGIGQGTVTLDASWSDLSAANATEDEDSFTVFAGLLLNDPISVGPISGKPRPYIRWVSDGTRGDEFAIGVQHVIDGHKASLTLEYSDWDGLGAGTDGSSIGIGAQFQF